MEAGAHCVVVVAESRHRVKVAAVAVVMRVGCECGMRVAVVAAVAAVAVASVALVVAIDTFKQSRTFRRRRCVAVCVYGRVLCYVYHPQPSLSPKMSAFTSILAHVLSPAFHAYVRAVQAFASGQTRRGHRRRERESGGR